MIESAPWKHPHIAKIGQFKEIWKHRQMYQDAANVAQNVPEVRGKAGPPLTEILTIAPDSQTRPVSLAEWTETAGWTIHNGSMMTLMPTFTAGKFKADLEALA